MPMKSVLFSTSVTNVCVRPRPRLRSVMSRTIFDAPMTLPSSSLIGEIVSDTRIRRPSLAAAPSRSARCAGRPSALAMISSSSARRSGGMTSEMWRPTASAAGVAEQALGRRVPALDHAVERLADDRVVRRLDDRGEQARREQLVCLSLLRRRRCAVTSRKISTQPDDATAARRVIGAALSSMGRSVPSLRDQHRVVREPHDDALRAARASRGSRPARASSR